MTDSSRDPLRKLQHDLANPLSAVLAHVQLLLQRADSYDQDTVDSLAEIERAARQMREILLAEE
jgi:light-regulated signal transduction histidine kinase (bacteriophytochrome)